jgi:hypothetical protein
MVRQSGYPGWRIFVSPTRRHPPERHVPAWTRAGFWAGIIPAIPRREYGPLSRGAQVPPRSLYLAIGFRCVWRGTCHGKQPAVARSARAQGLGLRRILLGGALVMLPIWNPVNE